MIKIQIANIEEFHNAYFQLIEPLVLERLNKLKISLMHLVDPDSIDEDDIVPVKTITKSIVNSMVKPKVANNAFNKPVYEAKVRSFRADADEVIDIDFDNLIALTDYLLDSANNSLKNLIIGEPLDLKDLHDTLFDGFDITEKLARDVMSSAFSYDDLGEVVRPFLYERNISRYCSYCNTTKAQHSNNPTTGMTVEQYHLDHFFSQVDHPMLGLSLFNLVPSDYVCNSANKGKLLFSNMFHLNPYVSGFKRDMVFEPVFDEVGERMLSIDLKIKVDRHSDRWKQFIGDEDDRDISPEHGNINVFQLYGKYNDESLIWRTQRLYNSYLKVVKNNRSIEDFLDSIENGESDRYANIKDWYEDVARTCFHENEFGKHAYSKLHRDLMDHVFSLYAERLGGDVMEIVESSYHQDNGGE